ncbi:unnamed protein product [Trichobilharzia regenti]|nr:unnamed protein product [Trichobilharzia regenti]
MDDLIDDDPSLVDCTIILEFALISRNRTFKPILINLPVKIQDINDNIPRFDQYTSGLRLEVSEDISSTISKYYTIPSLVYLPTLLSSISHSSSTSSPTGYWKGNSFHATESALLHQNKKRELAVLPLAKDVDYGVNGTVAYRLEVSDTFCCYHYYYSFRLHHITILYLVILILSVYFAGI